MNIINPTETEIRRFLNGSGYSDSRIDMIIKDDMHKGLYLKDIEDTLKFHIKAQRGKDMKDFYTSWSKIVMNYLNTGKVKGIECLIERRVIKKPTTMTKANIKLVIKAMNELGIYNGCSDDIITEIYNSINK